MKQFRAPFIVWYAAVLFYWSRPNFIQNAFTAPVVKTSRHSHKPSGDDARHKTPIKIFFNSGAYYNTHQSTANYCRTIYFFAFSLWRWCQSFLVLFNSTTKNTCWINNESSPLEKQKQTKSQSKKIEIPFLSNNV